MGSPDLSDQRPGILKNYRDKKRGEFAVQFIDKTVGFVVDLFLRQKISSLVFGFAAGSVITLLCLHFCGFDIGASLKVTTALDTLWGAVWKNIIYFVTPLF